MSRLDCPAADADEAQEVTRELSRTARSSKDLSAAASILESLSTAATSLTHSLRQLADLHDDPTAGRASVDGDPRAGRAASFRIAWELYRAAEMIDQVRDGIDRAHEIQETIAYGVCKTTTLAIDHRTPPHLGPSL